MKKSLFAQHYNACASSLNRLLTSNTDGVFTCKMNNDGTKQKNKHQETKTLKTG